MGLSFGMAVEGLDRLLPWLQEKPTKVLHGTAKGLYQSALVVMARSQEIVPVETGVLKASGTVNLPEINGANVEVHLGYGGAASAYALRQHEDLMYRHHDGQQAKFLERPLMEDEPNVLGRIADAIQAEG